MIELDGSQAGGQFVRTAVALSCLTGKPVRLTNIRGARPEPGLKVQHIEGIYSIGELCNAKMAGLELGSRTLTFEPGKLDPHDIKVRISTAGSIGLVLQAIMLATAKTRKGFTIDIKGGGTWGKWAPPVDYLSRVFFPLIGEKSVITVSKEGMYPKGGAEVVVEVKPLKLKPMELIEHGSLKEISVLSIASAHLQKQNVAERQADAAARALSEKLSTELAVETRYVETLSVGSGILLVAKCSNSLIGADNLGELGKAAEQVGKEVAQKLLDDYRRGAVDRHASDMLLPYMALAGSGSVKVAELTDHVMNNIQAVERFLPVKFRTEGAQGQPGKISVTKA